MKTKLFQSKKIEVRKSSIHGYGVFANSKISKGELLEECHYIPLIQKDDITKKYIFNWPAHTPTKTVLSLGFGSMYNAANSKKERTATWDTDLDNDILIFSTLKNIKADEEILIWYSYKDGKIYR